MGKLKTIFKDTAIYGLSSIVGRFLNYLLVPLYTAKFSAASGGYGIITNIYAYVALAMVLLTFGMETTYFRFTNKTHTDSETVYGTTLISVGTVSLLFTVLVLLLLSPISQLMGYGEHPDYVGVMAASAEEGIEICSLEAVEHSDEHPLECLLLRLDERQRCGLCVLYQSVLHGYAGSLLDYRVYGFPLEARLQVAAHHAQLLVAYFGVRHCRHPEPDR